MAIPSEVSHQSTPQPFFLSLKNDLSHASTVSQRIKRALAQDEELEVFAADEYINGGLDMLKPWKTIPAKELSYPSPAQRTCRALQEPTMAVSPGWKPPILSLFSWFRKSLSPSSPKVNARSSCKTSRVTPACDKKNQSTNLNLIRKFRTATVDTDMDFFSDSSSDLFELDTLSIGAGAFSGRNFKEETSAPTEWGLLQVGCLERKPFENAAGAHRASARHKPAKWNATSRPSSKLSCRARILAPISVLRVK